MKAMIRTTAVLALAMFIGHAAMAADPIKADPIKFGVVNEITGVSAQAGEFTVNGIKLAQEEINNAGSTEPKAVRAAILAIKGCKGLEGTYEFDQNGDGLHGYNIVKNEGGRIVFMCGFSL